MAWDRANRPIWFRYTASVVAVAIAAAVAWRLPGTSNFGTSFVTFYPAAAVSALYGGLGPGLLATLCSALLADYFWMPPAASLAIANTGDIMDMVLFLAGSLLVSSLIEMLYRSQGLAHKAQEELGLAAEREKTEKERKRLIQARLNLIEAAAAHTMEGFLRRALDEIGSIVGSPLGFYCSVEPGTQTISLKHWSTRTLEEFATTEGKSRHCSIDPAGLCAESARAKGPVIHNQRGLDGQSTGMPEGCGGGARCLVVPVMRDSNLVAFFGMGNKPLDYTHRDAETVAYLADVTWEIIERKLAAEKTAKLAAIVQASDEAVIGSDPQGIITSWNRGAQNIYGYTESEVLGKPASILLSPGYENDWLRLLERIRSGERIVHYETAGRTQQGRRVFLSLTISPVRNSEGKIVEVSTIGRDITEQKLSAEKISRQNEFLKTVLESLSHPFYVLDANDSTIKMANSALASGGLPADSRCFALLHGLDRPCRTPHNVCPVETIKRTGQPFTTEHTHHDAGGKARYTEIHGHPILDCDGKVDQIILYCLDITERKQSEEEKEKLSAQLRQAQKLEAIGTLAGGVAHDFNNILQPIVGYTEMALNRVGESDPLRNGLEQVLKASLRAKELVKQILSVSRARGEQQRTAIEIGAIIKEAMKLLRSVLPASIEIRENIETGVALAEATQIYQVLMNLCTNAAQAMDNKGILEVSLTNVKLSRSDCADPSLYRLASGPYLKLCVLDSGGGIEKETLERIFDPYFTTKEIGKGSGLGLAVVNGIVERHEGAITVESEPGKGARFTVYIPRIDAEFQEEVEVDLPLRQGSERILLIDDEPDVTTVGARLLELLGYRVSSYTDSVQALEVFRSNPDKFDLVISDFTMPGLTGMDLAAEVLQVRPGTPILLCTGFSEKIDPEGVKEMGAEILMKPYSLRQISETIRALLEDR